VVEKIDAEMKKFRRLRMAYELNLCDPILAKMIEKLYAF
jgi:hypothetical protein